jgi:hypothetical protein
MLVLYEIMAGVLLLSLLPDIVEPQYFFDDILRFCTPEDLALCVSGMTNFPLLFSAIASIAALSTYKRKTLLIGMVLNYALLALAWIFDSAINFLPVGPHPGGTGLFSFGVMIALLLLGCSFLNLCLIPFWIHTIVQVKHR